MVSERFNPGIDSTNLEWPTGDPDVALEDSLHDSTSTDYSRPFEPLGTEANYHYPTEDYDSSTGEEMTPETDADSPDKQEIIKLSSAIDEQLSKLTNPSFKEQVVMVNGRENTVRAHLMVFRETLQQFLFGSINQFTAATRVKEAFYELRNIINIQANETETQLTSPLRAVGSLLEAENIPNAQSLLNRLSSEGIDVAVGDVSYLDERVQRAEKLTRSIRAKTSELDKINDERRTRVNYRLGSLVDELNSDRWGAETTAHQILGLVENIDQDGYRFNSYMREFEVSDQVEAQAISDLGKN